LPNAAFFTVRLIAGRTYDPLWFGVYCVVSVVFGRWLEAMIPPADFTPESRASVLLAFVISAFVTPFFWIILFAVVAFARSPDKPLFL
jgi:hypothetical protein